ncbi:MAG: Lrp/AsnC ligand binding domain-containing protein [Gammaproteobacteria bacterium]|nr:Lrp/AsnC ligand binding domain-containing protein [Gammaproteobacteria bacterium]MDH3465767.1 Lrp/AsnC ligand binding domain-containing protein [Gammaproteobacteria bacterium]
MVTAIILLGVERQKIKSVAELLAGQSEISEVFSVSGNYELVAIIRVKTNDDLANLVTDKLANVEGIEHTETMLAFRTYSRHDLEAMFSVGQ